MENQDPTTFVDKQLELNKKVTKTLTGFVQGLETQDKINQQVTEYLLNQDTRLDTLNRLVVALTTFVVVTLCGVLILIVTVNS